MEARGELEGLQSSTTWDLEIECRWSGFQQVIYPLSYLDSLKIVSLEDIYILSGDFPALCCMLYPIIHHPHLGTKAQLL